MSRWRARTRLLACAALLLGCACAAPPRAAGPAAAREGWLTPLAWEARAPGSEGAVYLLGSIHVGRRDMGRLHPAIVAAYERSEELVVEVDVSAEADGGLARAWEEYAYLPAGRRLDQVIAPETWQRLSAWLAERDIDAEPLLPLEPWAVLLRLAREEFARAGYAAEQGVDRRFLDAAAGRKRIVALESYELQLALYDGFSYEIQEQMLLDLLSPEDSDHASALVEAWGRGDEQAFLDLIFPDDERWLAYQERFFYERNARMAERLAELARDGRTRFVVVGVGHMVGPRGIPALLAARGFDVRRIGRD